MVMLAGAADGTASATPSVIPEPALPPVNQVVEPAVDEKKDATQVDLTAEEKEGEDKEPKPEPKAKGPEK